MITLSATEEARSKNFRLIDEAADLRVDTLWIN